jgi:hypothetical protein
MADLRKKNWGEAGASPSAPRKEVFLCDIAIASAVPTFNKIIKKAVNGHE